MSAHKAQLLLVSRQGKVRLSKWFKTAPPKNKSKLIKDVTQLVLSRRTKMCNFLEYKDEKVVYRRYASLFFIVGINNDDNELIALELIHRYVEILDRYFGNVCELDLIFNFQKAFSILDELILAGELQESSKKNVLRNVTQADSIQDSEESQQSLIKPRRSSSISSAIRDMPNPGQIAPKKPNQTSNFLMDLITMKWMIKPSTSFKMIIVTLVAWLNWQWLTPDQPNPISPLLLLSNQVPRHSDDPVSVTRYAKSYRDILFVLFYTIVFSFLRQFITLHVLQPLAVKIGTKPKKIPRFLEQAYTFLYFLASGSIGIWVMYQEPTWWYRTEHFWLGYPHWDMKYHIKLYYLLQTSYWLQQMLVLILRLEKPRKDFNELVMHHIVTLWLILWSYLINLSMIGNAIFVTMDVSDIFLALAKCYNYVRPGHWLGNFIFGFFILVWTYMRHWLNMRILYSVWSEFTLIPLENRRWWTPDGVWMVDWMQWQIFLPILLLQFLNLFWYFLIWRILIRALVYNHLADERSDDEDDGEDAEDAKVGKEQ
ncbi:hypothetical protein E3P99_03981 [Wallemia hederae]|uniref:AP-1 complex subunit sigma-1 n=1 Tax=Wallemia hederae TaxID=1540922 RepID=A0A4T0FBP5_9BASI|nr:hypothetical protein E3P99_03981 [Wallemia hederae]